MMGVEVEYRQGTWRSFQVEGEGRHTEMRFVAVFIITFLSSLVFPEPHETRIGYNCDPDRLIYLKTDPAILDAIVLGSSGTEHVLRKTADSPLDTFADAEHEVAFETLKEISVIEKGLKVSCRARS